MPALGDASMCVKNSPNVFRLWVPAACGDLAWLSDLLELDLPAPFGHLRGMFGTGIGNGHG